MNRKNKILVLGIGNYLMKDEGIGVHIIKELEKKELPSYIELLDGGTGGFHLLSYLEDYKKVILIDAAIDHFEEGTIRHLRPKFATDFPPSLSAHEIGLKDLIESLILLETIPDISLIAVSVKNFNTISTELTPIINSKKPEIQEMVLKIAQECIEDLAIAG